jgi:glycosyltransferase involved in cell wall biosynthesis
MNKLVSICVATYNGEKYIREQLDSLLSQTYQHLEILLQDDCSTDNTFQILTEYAEQYDNIKLFQNKKNLVLDATAASLNDVTYIDQNLVQYNTNMLTKKKKNSNSISLKYALGYKLYKVFPIL